MKRAFWPMALGILLAAAVPALLGGRSLLPQLAAFPPERLLGMLGLIVLAWNLNAGRIRLLLAGQQLPQRRALGILMATEFAISASPGGAGGPLTYVALLRREGVPGVRAAAAYAVDQLMDMLFFLSALAALATYLLVRAVDLHTVWQLLLPGALLTGGLVTAFVLARHERRLLRLGGSLLHALRIPPRRRLALARKALGFRAALAETLRLPRSRLFAVYLLCCGHWLLRYSMLYLAVRGLGGQLDWSYAFLVQMLALAAGQFTFTPGGAGGAEVTAGALLGAVLPLETVAAAILVWRFATYYWYLLAGGAAFVWVGGSRLWRDAPATAGGVAP